MKEEKEQTVIDKTLLYLENYREMERYIKEAVSETSQVPDIWKNFMQGPRMQIISFITVPLKEN